MHNKMAERVLRAKILFFDSNPIGRILTHFSKDMVSIDFVISALTPVIAYGFFRAASVAIAVCVVNPYVLIPLVGAAIYMVYILRNCQAALVESQRYDGIIRGPIHDKFAMQIIGLVTIRAYKRLEYFNIKYMIENERSANVTFTQMTANRWLGLRFDLAILVVTFAATAMCMIFRNTIEADLLTFSLQNLTDVCVYFSVSIRMWAEVQFYMTSSQRIVKYTELPMEPPLEAEKDKSL